MQVKSMRLVFSGIEKKRCLAAVSDIMRRGMVCQGKYVQSLEKKIREISGLKHVLAVGSGTQAIELSCLYFKKFPQKKKGATVLVPVNTFIATALAAEKAGFKVRFVDIEKDFLGMDFAVVRAMIKKDKQIVGVLPVHIGGFINPGIKRFAQFCKKAKVWLVEDCAHAFGTSGAGHYGQFGAFSFFSTKVFTSGEGGAIVTDNKHAYEYLSMMRNFGKPNPWESYHVMRGYNYRMNELGAALLAAQLHDWKSIIAERTKIAQHYIKGLDKSFAVVRGRGRQCWYKVIVHTRQPAAEVKKTLAAAGIQCQGSVYEIPLHQMPVYSELRDKRFPVAEYCCNHHVCLPIYRGLGKEKIEYVIKNVNKMLTN